MKFLAGKRLSDELLALMILYSQNNQKDNYRSKILKIAKKILGLTIVFALVLNFNILSLNIFTTTNVANAQTGAIAVTTVEQIKDILKSKIQSKNDEIERLEREITTYQGELRDVSSQASSLSQAVSELDITSKKLRAELKVTQAKIDRVNLDLESLGDKISSATEDIGDGKDSLGALMRRVHQSDDSTLIEVLLEAPSVAAPVNALENYSRLTGGVTEAINHLTVSKTNLESTRKSVQQKRKELTDLKNELTDQAKLIADTAKEKQSILTVTKNRESNYMILLADKQKQKEEFEQEISSYEAALKLAVDPSKLPKVSAGVLQWPLDSVVVTQHFGQTEFATRNPQGYNGLGHNGIDLRAAIGTPIKASSNGTVIGVGNTGLIRGCYSYGKWVMIKHPNGLSTLYAHMSLQKVVVGEQVFTGQLIGYSGNTGYTTGPHLHFGVYATEGVRITAISSSTRCKGAIIPTADYKAYLNPLSYLPEI